MDDENIIDTPASEVNEAQEGSVAAEIDGAQPEKKQAHESQTVPLSAYLDLKNDVKELKQALKERDSKADTSAAVAAGVADLAAKYPDVNVDFIADMVAASTKKAQETIESKYSPIIERQEAEKKAEKFEKAFENAKAKVVEENPDLPTVDWDAIKALALTPNYINLPLADVVQKVYGGIINKGRATSENDMRGGADRVDDIVDFGNLTPDQEKKVLANPKTRKAYFDHLDGLPNR